MSDSDGRRPITPTAIPCTFPQVNVSASAASAIQTIPGMKLPVVLHSRGRPKGLKDSCTGQRHMGLRRKRTATTEPDKFHDLSKDDQLKREYFDIEVYL